MCRHLKHYLAYTEFEAVLGQMSISITVELDVLAASSPPSFFFSFASTSCCSSGLLAVGRDCGLAGGEPWAGEVGDAGEAGDAGETGDGGDVGEVGEGGERGAEGGVWWGRPSPSRPSWFFRSTESAPGSGFSSVLVRSPSWLGTNFWEVMLMSY